jgi:D-sedoheptulose 7-phosphate isomerase
MMNNGTYIRNYLAEVKEIAGRMPVADIDGAVALLYDAWQNGHQVFICGNGGSASTATHFACDLAKTTIIDGRERFKVECLNDNIPLMLALVNDDGFDNLFIEQLKAKFGKGDIIICISVHGGAGRDKSQLWSQNLLRAMRYARENGGKAIGFSGFDGGPMKDMADVCVVVPANSTPQVESFHLAIEHLICNNLRKIMEESPLT